MRPETFSVNQRIVLSALDCIREWEKWTEAVPLGPAKELNLSLIRLTKGLVKAWRSFLIDVGQL